MAAGESFSPVSIRVCHSSQIKNPAKGLGTYHNKQSNSSQFREKAVTSLSDLKEHVMASLGAGSPKTALPSPASGQAISKACCSLQLLPCSPEAPWEGSQ